MSAWQAVVWVAVAWGPGETATALLEECRAGKFEAAVGRFDATMRKVMPAETLKKTWGQLTGSVGEVKTLGTPRLKPLGTHTLALIRCEFTLKTLDVQVSIDKDGRVDGLFFKEPEKDPNAKSDPAAAYVKPDAFVEREVTVGAKDWPLGGTLAMPKDRTGTVPLVVLVHGSGPHDRDETIGPNTPFRDLGQGLASRGIATLRYEKRTKAHAAKIKDAGPASITIDAEVVDDALAAVAFARSVEGVDPTRIFVAGHSLGASLAPEIARRDGKLAGIILLAPADRRPDVTVLQQLDYLEKNDPTQSAGIKAMRPGLEAGFRKLAAGQAKPEEIIMGAPAAYWSSWMAIRPSATAATLADLPMLIVRGERDYQIIDADLAGFRAGLKDRKDVTIKAYSGLNHLFLMGKGLSLPAEYGVAGHVDVRVIDDLAAFVTAPRRSK